MSNPNHPRSWEQVTPNGQAPTLKDSELGDSEIALIKERRKVSGIGLSVAMVEHAIAAGHASSSEFFLRSVVERTDLTTRNISHIAAIPNLALDQPVGRAEHWPPQ